MFCLIYVFILEEKITKYTPHFLQRSSMSKDLVIYICIVLGYLRWEWYLRLVIIIIIILCFAFFFICLWLFPLFYMYLFNIDCTIVLSPHPFGYHQSSQQRYHLSLSGTRIFAPRKTKPKKKPCRSVHHLQPMIPSWPTHTSSWVLRWEF